MKLGATYKFIIPSNLAYGGYGANASYTNNAMPAYSTLIYDVQLMKIVKDPVAYDTTFIHKWADSLKLNVLSNDVGKVYYKVNSTRSGDSLLKDGEQVKVVYQGKVIEENVFFTDSTKYDSVTFILGANQVINGWELVLISRYHSLYYKLNKVVRVN
jgi:FKBP-type peptidyl-prolyl cis-trans isomerase